MGVAVSPGLESNHSTRVTSISRFWMLLLTFVFLLTGLISCAAHYAPAREEAKDSGASRIEMSPSSCNKRSNAVPPQWRPC